MNMEPKEIMKTRDSSTTGADSGPKSRFAAAGSVIGAVLASSCCIVPLLLVTLGVSGAWIGTLSGLEPYKPWFVAVAIAFLGFGFWQVYRKPAPTCEDGSYCANPSSGRVVKVALWFAAILILLTLTIDFWAPIFY